MRRSLSLLALGAIVHGPSTAFAAAPTSCQAGGDYYFGGNGGASGAIQWLWGHKDYFDGGLPRWFIQFKLVTAATWFDNPFLDRVTVDRYDDASSSWIPMYSFMDKYARGLDSVYDAQTVPGEPADPMAELTIRINFIDDDETACPQGSTPAVALPHFGFISGPDQMAAVAAGTAQPAGTPAWLHPGYPEDVSLCDANDGFGALHGAAASDWLQSLTATKLCDCSWRIDVRYAPANGNMVNNPFIDYVSFRLGVTGGGTQVRMLLHQPGTSTYTLATSKFSCDVDYIQVDTIVMFDEFDAVPGHIQRDTSCYAVPAAVNDFCLADGVTYAPGAFGNACAGMGSDSSTAVFSSGGSCPYPAGIRTPAPTPEPSKTLAPVVNGSGMPAVGSSLTLQVENGNGATYEVADVFSGAKAASGDVSSLTQSDNGAAVDTIDLKAGCYRLTVSATAVPEDLVWSIAGTNLTGSALTSVDFAAGGALCGAGDCMRDCHSSAMSSAAKDATTCDVHSAAITSSCASKCSLDERRAAKASCYNYGGCEKPQVSCHLPTAAGITSVGRASISVLLSGVSGAQLLANSDSLAAAAATWLNTAVTDVSVTAVDGVPVEDGAWLGGRRQRRRLQKRRLQSQDGSSSSDFASVQLAVATETADGAQTLAATAEASGDALQALLASAGLAKVTVQNIVGSYEGLYAVDFGSGSDTSSGASTSASDDDNNNNGNASSPVGNLSDSQSKVVIAAAAAGGAALLLLLVAAAVVLVRRNRDRKKQVQPVGEGKRQPLPRNPVHPNDEELADDNSVAPLR